MHQRYLLAPLAALAAATLVACGGSSTDDSTGSQATGTTGASSASTVAAGPHNDIDVEFAQMMIPHHQQAVEMAKLAAGRAGNPQVKQLAATIAAAQQPEIATMTGWLTAWGQPTTMPSMSGMPTASASGGHDMGGATMPGMMSDGDMMTLEALTGTEFDRSFLTMMTTHHQGAIDMAKAEQSEGLYRPAIELAESIQTSQATEVRTMKNLLTKL